MEAWFIVPLTLSHINNLNFITFMRRMYAKHGIPSVKVSQLLLIHRALLILNNPSTITLMWFFYPHSALVYSIISSFNKFLRPLFMVGATWKIWRFLLFPLMKRPINLFVTFLSFYRIKMSSNPSSIGNSNPIICTPLKKNLLLYKVSIKFIGLVDAK